ncbi:MAG: hypothetical protein AB4352_20025 [Hormoscilla sp.]
MQLSSGLGEDGRILTQANLPKEFAVHQGALVPSDWQVACLRLGGRTGISSVTAPLGSASVLPLTV